MRFSLGAAALMVLAALAFTGTATAATGLNAYTVRLEGGKQLAELKAQGFDITEGQRKRSASRSSARNRQIAKLRRAGVEAKLLRDRRGRTAKRAAAAQAEAGWQVWRPYARTDVSVSGAAGNPVFNIKSQMERLARRYDHIAELADDRRDAQRRSDLRDEGHEERHNPAKGRLAPGGPLLGQSSTRASGSPARPPAGRCGSSSTTTAAGASRSAPTTSRSRACRPAS